MPNTTITHSSEHGSNNPRVRHSVPVGTSQWIFVNPSQTALAVMPGAGGTMNVQYTQSPPEVVAADNLNSTSTALALTWPKGAVSAAADGLLQLATAVRFVAGVSAGVAEISETR